MPAPTYPYFKQIFMDYLPGWLKRQPQAVLWAGSYGDLLQDTWQTFQDVKLIHSHILTSTGDQLDWWGRDFEIYREPGEIDEVYSPRIIREVTSRKITKTAILNAIRLYMTKMGLTENTHYVFHWSDPAKFTFRLAISFTVDNPTLIAKVNFDQVKAVIMSTRAAGIYALLAMNGSHYYTNPSSDESTVHWSGWLTTNGAGTLNSTYTLGNTSQIEGVA